MPFSIRIAVVLTAFAALGVTGCATAPPAPVAAPSTVPIPPPLTRDALIAVSRHDTLRASIIVDARSGGKRLTGDAPAAVYLQAPDKARLRLYRFGVPVLDVLYAGGLIVARPNRGTDRYRSLVPRLVDVLFWWRHLDTATFAIGETDYVFRSSSGEVRIDRRTLLPRSQTLLTSSGRVDIRYATPRRFERNRIYPSRITLSFSSSTVEITIRKLSVDIPLDAGLFEPAG